MTADPRTGAGPVADLTDDDVVIVEVGPRDGLQNESSHVPTERKIAFIEALADAGHRRIEATAFVSPKVIPQLADADAVAAHLPVRDGLRFTALVPNAQGMERARRTGIQEWAVFTAASETFNQKNINCSIDESFSRFVDVIAGARADGIRVRGYCSTSIHCPYEGRVPTSATVDVVRRLLEAGCNEVSLGETIGKGTPGQVHELCSALASEGLLSACAVHFHDTYGMGAANALAAYDEGVRIFDASAGGLGGCPYAPGAAGNTATEDLLFMFNGMGVKAGVDLDKQVAASRLIEHVLKRPMPSNAYRALEARGKKRRPNLEMS
ncbi:MAG: hydroxymethylglutaryl-CoA lyase [Planctomycetes bacterium]|nr:hydroxymethylglutaryl-CoA lyase [Planctomycetota bacterium]